MKNRKLLLSALLFAIIGMIANSAMSSPYISTDDQGWIEVGPNNLAGRSRVAIFDKFNSGVMYAGSVGGLYVSVNNGKNWQEISLGNKVENVTALAQDDEGYLYVGTGEGYYSVTMHRENPIGKNNTTTGAIGSGLYKQNEGFDKQWANNLSTDEEKYNYVREHFNFTVIPSTIPSDKYDPNDEWAFINVIAYCSGNLYVGTKNAGLKISSNGGAFENTQIFGNIFDIQVNSEGRVAVASDEGVFLSSADNNKSFNMIFSNVTPSSVGYMFGNIKVAFGQKNPKDLFVMPAFDLVSLNPTAYTAQGYNAQILGIYRPVDRENGVYTISSDSAAWFNLAPASLYNGTNLADGMSICLDDRQESEILYIGGTYLQRGEDVNGVGIFSFDMQTMPTASDTLGYFAGTNINNILLLPNCQNANDSSFIFITTNAGPFRYCYDTIIRVRQWFPSTKGMNSLQAYHVAAAADGSIMTATQSNAIVYMPSYSDSTLKSGMKVWSVNNANYPISSDAIYSDEKNQSGSNVLASAMYRTSPQARKPFLFARPGTNVTRTYGNQGDFLNINDQSWTYGSDQSQTLMVGPLTSNCNYDQFNTPMALWEGYDVTNTVDSIVFSLTKYSTIHRNGEALDCRDGREIKEGDSVLVQSNILGYPFFHVFSRNDITSLQNENSSDNYTLGSGNVLFYKNYDVKIKVPQKVQTRALVANTTGVFLCGKIFDFSSTYCKDANARTTSDLTWAKILHNGGNISAPMGSTTINYSSLNKRVNAVALSADGSSAFIAVDLYSDYTTYDRTVLIRVSGLNDLSINNPFEFMGGSDEANLFTRDTIATFNRQISSIECDPTIANNMIITFDGYNNTETNIKKTTNALAATVNFTDIKIGTDNRKPVFCAIYGKVGASNGKIYAGSDDGIYVYNGSSWTKEPDVPAVPVYDICQQTSNLPQWNFLSYTGENSEEIQFNAANNRGVMYAATYGKGILVNEKYLDTTVNTVSIENVTNMAVEQLFRVYPNPANDQATISYSLNTPSEVVFRMFDINGREVSTYTTSRQAKGLYNQPLNISNLRQGVYMLQMITNSGSKTTKLIVK